MPTIRGKAEQIVSMFNVLDANTKQQAIAAVMEVLQQPDEIPPSELRELFDAVKMIATSVVQHQQFMEVDLQRVLLLMGMDERFDIIYSKEQLDTIVDRQTAPFKLINAAIAKLHNVGVRVGFQPGRIVDDHAMFDEFVVLSNTFKQAVANLRRKAREADDGEDWKQGPPEPEN